MRRALVRLLMLACGLALLEWHAHGPSAQEPERQPLIDGIVFTSEHGTLYVPVDEVAAALTLPLTRSDAGKRVHLAGVEIAPGARSLLPDGTELIRLRSLAAFSELDVSVSWDADQQTAHIQRGDREAWVRQGWRTVTGAITFAAAPGTLYVPLREVSLALDLSAGLEAEGSETPLARGEQRTLGDGTQLVRVQALGGSATLRWRNRPASAHLERSGRELWVRRGPKRVALNLGQQRMRAWEGDRLVLESRISSGRKSMETPTGSFRAGPLKSRLVISRKYGNAEMPWSVQVHGNVLIHGFATVPPRAASHGCIRVPLTGQNPARWFYHWVTIGTPIEIGDDWPEGTGFRDADPLRNVSPEDVAPGCD